MLKEFKQFLLRGNVVDLAVGVIIGSAFSSVVNALVADILNPFISLIARIPDFSDIVFKINNNEFLIGHLLNTVISFMIVAATIFFFIIKPMNILVARSRKEAPADPTTKKCSECLSEIPIDAKRCAYCAQPVAKTKKK